MALRIPAGTEPRGRGQAGVSLIELVVAVSLSALVAGMGMALFRDVSATARLLGGAGNEAFETRAVFGALCDNLQAGQGVLSLRPGRLLLLNAAGKKVEYAWDDSTLTVNGRPWKFRLASLEITPAGPSLPAGAEWTRERMELADADSLDDDRDGLIDFDELDQDRSGELEPLECSWIAGFGLKLETVREGVVTARVAFLHPRNHARGITEEDLDALDALPGVGDFGR